MERVSATSARALAARAPPAKGKASCEPLRHAQVCQFLSNCSWFGPAPEASCVRPNDSGPPNLRREASEAPIGLLRAARPGQVAPVELGSGARGRVRDGCGQGGFGDEEFMNQPDPVMRNLVPTGRFPQQPRRNIVARHLHGLGSGRKRHGWSLRRTD